MDMRKISSKYVFIIKNLPEEVQRQLFFLSDAKHKKVLARVQNKRAQIMHKRRKKGTEFRWQEYDYKELFTEALQYINKQ